MINRVTKRPVANAFISGSGSADTYGAWYVDADISQPLSESVSTRMNAVYEEFRNNRDFYDEPGCDQPDRRALARRCDSDRSGLRI